MPAIVPIQAHPIDRDRIGGIQRGRLLSATVEVVNEYGLAETTVARIVARAGVSRRTFYELFGDRDQCFLATLNDAIDRAAASVISAYQSTDNWHERIQLALAALLGFLDANRSTGQFLIVGSLGAGADAFERRQAALAALIAAIDQGRHHTKTVSPPLTAEGVVGGALAIVHARIQANGETPLTMLYPQLMSMIVMPYLGSAAARRELTRRPPPPPPRRPARPDVDVLRDLGIRLTYRTTLVLSYLAECPGSSNRQIGVATGIPDQGQTSKLLHRLQRLNLIENTSGPPHQGTPNAWRLTARGHSAQRAISADTHSRAMS